MAILSFQQKQFVGKIELPFYFSLNNFILVLRHRFIPIDYYKLIFVEHFCSKSHNFSKDTNFTIIEKKKKRIG